MASGSAHAATSLLAAGSVAKMNAWQLRRHLSGWSGRYVEWTEGKTAYLSVVFSWQVQRAYQRAAWWQQLGCRVKVGGPAVAFNPAIFDGIAETGNGVNALPHHNPDATFTSRGCIRRCPFCIVPIVEGDLVELEDWEPRPVVCDNNFLACSRRHFDQAVDRLKSLKKVDFNQGLDARLLTDYHADRLAELDFKMLRLAWDFVELESQFVTAFKMLRKIGVPAGKIGVYVLIGYEDTPEDALYRLSTVWDLGAWPFPMRYQPLDAASRNEYVGANWTDRELKRYARYWSNLRHLSGVPFDEYRG